MTNVHDSEDRRVRCVLHETWLKEMKEDVRDIKHILTGNGSPEKGLVVRVCELEKVSSGATRVAWILVLGAMSGFGTLLWKMFDFYHKQI